VLCKFRQSFTGKPLLLGAGFLALLAGLSVSETARADEPYRFYGGFGAGSSISDPELTELHLLAGIQAAPNVAVELSSFRLHSPVEGSQLNDARIYNLGVQLQAPEFEHLTAFVTTGLAETRFHGLEPGPEHAAGVGYGVGVQSAVGKRVQVRLEWQELNTEGPAQLRPPLMSLTLGMRF
jgi:hypothetical protein